ncbi:winged helix DNA-binding domain-containing protein [Actinomadura scrupuli]|uniref:winged helix DNA-binding domain-containing protein n=1 Tax=Actinomadura scrupuli TaxID=559629 RepID=UPI003D97A21B
MRLMSVAERRARLGVRHRLAESARTDDVTQIARDLVALHSTDPASVYLAAVARMRVPAPAAVDEALYGSRTLLRMLGMRRTVFVVPVERAPVVHAASTLGIAARERTRTERFLAEEGMDGDVAGWLRETDEAALRALKARGEATGAQLSADEPRLRTRITLARGKSYGGTQNIVSRVLFVLAAEGRIVRGRPVGSWISSQYRWSPVESWLPGGMAELPPDAARVELARDWLAAYGPATAADLKWWTGWTTGEVKRALAELRPVEVDLGGAVGLLLPGDSEPVPAPEPWAALLPALDPTAMGWAGRAWYLGDHGPALFDRTGNIGPTIWWDGRIVGGWAQRPDGEVAVRLLEDVGADAADAVRAEAGRLTERLGDARVTPRFRTPLERELSA